VTNQLALWKYLHYWGFW